MGVAPADGRVPVIVISGVNLVEGGTLTAFREMVRAAALHRPRCEVVALVHRPGLLGIEGVTELPFPAIKPSWLKRLWFEWVSLRRLSRELAPDVWVSMHDITPVVVAPRQFVYCHNPGPFSKLPARQAWKDKRFWLFTLFYGTLYRINIFRNSAVIVQQQWLREEFERRYGMRRVIVAHPTGIPAQAYEGSRADLPKRFLYPTMPRVFKNIEGVGDALRILEADPRWHGTVSITIDGSESDYARGLVERYRDLRTIRFIGLHPHSEMDRCYSSADVLLFASLLETWGLPLSEAKARHMPIIAADLPYAHETIGEHDQARFFRADDPGELARLMLALHLGEEQFSAHRAAAPLQPFASGWAELMTMMLAPAPDFSSAAREVS